MDEREEPQGQREGGTKRQAEAQVELSNDKGPDSPAGVEKEQLSSKACEKDVEVKEYGDKSGEDNVEESTEVKDVAASEETGGDGQGAEDVTAVNFDEIDSEGRRNQEEEDNGRDKLGHRNAEKNVQGTASSSTTAEEASRSSISTGE